MNLEKEQRKLTGFVEKYNRGMIDQNKMIREMIADQT